MVTFLPLLGHWLCHKGIFFADNWCIFAPIWSVNAFPSNLVALLESAKPTPADLLTSEKCSALNLAIISPTFVWFSLRSCLIKSPVLIPTGQRWAHKPVAAQVSIPIYSKSVSSWCSSWVSLSFTISASRNCCIRRQIAMRCLGVKLKSCEGQTASQKPHSMHLSTISFAFGRSLRFLMWLCVSALSITPGFKSPVGSMISLSFVITL